ncbi:unnamed protein product [Ceutorhynchus assimilis]|uniref:Uncharacterized protein n=1 Tax=Ceutorhynchus assimilis TaxID=467358 RepID=A0A9P0DD73_9CUCU|nr:unnamed protein product [Ceutorhynchus assimilis]
MMKGRVLFGLILFICTYWNPIQSAAVSSNDDQSKLSYNSIASTSKPDLLSYQQITHYGQKYLPQHVAYRQQFQPVRSQQLVQTVPYNHQPEPTSKPYHVAKPQNQVAMVIIAQPAYIPASMLQHDNVAQQILQYFHGGSFQSRYQYQPLQHQSYQQAQPSYTHYMQYQPKQFDFQPKQLDYHQKQLDFQPKQPEYQSQFQPKQSDYQQKQPDYQPQYQQEALPTPQALVSQNQDTVDHQQPTEDITRLAQQAAHHFLQNGGLGAQSRTAPAIITGLELFPAEQQEKIKAQLSEHFGSPLKRLNFDSGDLQQLHQPQQNSYRKFYQQQERKERFRPSVEVKDGEITVGRGKM